MNIAVTGSAGFIGTHVVSLLRQQGHEVTEIDIRDAYRHDILRDGARMIADAEPEVVIHLAAHISVTESTRDPRFDAEQNIIGSIAVLDACARANVRRVVLASSGGALYAQDVRRLPFAEGAHLNPTSPYGLSKKIMEEYAALYARMHPAMSIFTLRLSNVYGPGQLPPAIIPALLTAVKEGHPPTLRMGSFRWPTRDYVHVRDVARAFALAATSNAPGSLTINIGSGRETTNEELWVLCSQRLDAPYVLYPLVPGEVERSALDNRRAVSVLGWLPHERLESAILELRVDYGLSDTPLEEEITMHEKRDSSVTSTVAPSAPVGGAQPVSEDEVTKAAPTGSSHTPGAGSSPKGSK